MAKLSLALLYRCSANYKTRFDHVVDLQDHPEASGLKKQDVITMGECGTLPEDTFFGSAIHPYSYNDEFDHDLLTVVDVSPVDENSLVGV